MTSDVAWLRRRQIFQTLYLERPKDAHSFVARATATSFGIIEIEYLEMKEVVPALMHSSPT
jgi:hypothetical protein